MKKQFTLTVFTLSLLAQSAMVSAKINVNDRFRSEYNSHNSSQYNSVIKPVHLHAQNSAIKSKREVMSKVSKQYDAQVLKIQLNSEGTSYSVRILLPSGKVKTVTVNALN